MIVSTSLPLPSPFFIPRLPLTEVDPILLGCPCHIPLTCRKPPQNTVGGTRHSPSWPAFQTMGMVLSAATPTTGDLAPLLFLSFFFSLLCSCTFACIMLMLYLHAVVASAALCRQEEVTLQNEERSRAIRLQGWMMAQSGVKVKL